MKSEILIKRNMIVIFGLIALTCFINPKLAIMVTYVWVVYFALKRNTQTFIFFLVFCVFQNLMMILCANKFNGQQTTFFCLSKEFMLYLTVFLWIISKASIKDLKLKKNLLEFITVILILFSIFQGVILSTYSLHSKLVSIRTILLPLICLAFGYIINKDINKLNKLLSFITYIAAAITIVGIIDLAIFYDTIWLKFPFVEFLCNKGTYEGLSVWGLPTSFTTWDFAKIFGGIAYRLIGIFAEPLTTAHFSFGIFVLSKYSNVKMKKIMRAIILIGCILSFSKGIYIMLVIYTCFYIFPKLAIKKIKNTYIFIDLLVACLFVFGVILISNQDLKINAINATLKHLEGFVNGFKYSKIFGGNLGGAGSVAYMLEVGNSGTSNISITESWIGALAYQLGLLPCLLYIFLIIKIVFLLIKKYKVSGKKVYKSIAVLIGCVVLESFLSDSAVSISGTGFYFMVAGMLSSINICEENYLLARRVNNENRNINISCSA